MRGKEAYARLRQAEGGDPREKYLYLVGEQADRALSRLPPGIVERDELISQGAIGLLEGLESFSPDRGVPVEAYLRTTIRFAILTGLRQQDRVPKGLRAKERIVKETYARLEQQALRPATDEEMATHLSITPEAFRNWLLDLAYTTVWSLESLEEIRGVEPEERGPGPEEEALEGELRGVLVKAVERLPKREKEVLWAHYFEGFTLQEVALALSLSESYVSQLHSRAILRLRGALGRQRAVLLGVKKK